MIKMTPKQVSAHKRNRVRTELKLELGTLILNFKSKEEPRIKLTGVDIAKVLNELLKQELHYL